MFIVSTRVELYCAALLRLRQQSAACILCCHTLNGRLIIVALRRTHCVLILLCAVTPHTISCLMMIAVVNDIFELRTQRSETIVRKSVCQVSGKFFGGSRKLERRIKGSGYW
jgi:hypothetical protein